MQRTQKSIYNVSVTLITNVFILGTAFLVQKALVSTMGADYNGINGLFTSIISMMSLTDLGIGSAIIYHLYRPAAENNYEETNSLLKFYRHSYMLISFVVLLIGSVIMLFMPQLVGTIKISDNLYLIFVLFMVDCLSSYFLSYKKSLLYAYQMSFILDGIHFLYYILQNMIQLAVLWYYKSYIGFLVIKTLSKWIENITISIYIRQHYSFTREKKVKELKEDIKSDIFVKIKALLFHRLGRLFVTGSDSLVITGVLGIYQMNLYTNYHLIVGGVTALLNKIFETLTYSVGNFLLESSQERNREVYRKIDFLNFWVFGLSTVILYNTLQPMVSLWLGDDFLVSKIILFMFVFNFYQEGMRVSIITFKDAAGIYYTDRYVPLVEAVINVIISVVLAKILGMAGVFAGTIISSGVVYFYSYPKYVCAPLFNMSKREYLGRLSIYAAMVVTVLFSAEFILNLFRIENRWLEMIGGVLISTLVFHFAVFCLYRKSQEMIYFRMLIRKEIQTLHRRFGKEG